MNQETAKNNNVFFVHIASKEELYQAYMSYVTNGGLFIVTDKNYQLEDEVFLLIKLIDEPEQFTVAGKVVWITPNNAQGGKEAGIGVQFTSEEAQPLKKLIETYLAGTADSTKSTETL